MVNSNLEQRVSRLEVQMQEIRDLLQQTVLLQNRTQQQLDQTQQQLDQTQQQLDQTQKQLDQTQKIAESNARSIQAWESLIEQNQIEAEEERSVLRVEINDLKQANRDNIAQHFDFRERFDRVIAEIADLQRKVG